MKDLEFFMFLSSGSVSARSGYCQAWVADVYQAVTGSIGEIKIQSLESWIKTYKGFAWGWENSDELV